MYVVKTKRRDDIQILRGIAIVAVVLNHFHIPFVHLVGGFRGVDMFFVISGFVIAKSLMEREKSGLKASFDFMAQRIRRLYPAFFSVTTLTILILMSNEWLPYVESRLDDTARAAVLYYQNFWLLSQRFSYFEPSFNNPFTHIWSLAVEEQFYLLTAFYIFIVGLFKKKILITLYTTGILLVVSYLAMKIWGEGSRHPVFDISNDYAGFMLPDLRAWQILLGVLASIGSTRSERLISRIPSWIKLLTFYAGSLAILISLAFREPRGNLHNADHRVNIFASIICISTATLLWLSTNINPPRRPPLVKTLKRLFCGLGDRSYSIYLIHWPIASLTLEFFDVGKNSWVIEIFLLLILSEFLYRTVEWWWVKRKLSNRLVLTYFILGQVLLLALIFYWSQSASNDPERSGAPIQTLTDLQCGPFTLPFKCSVKFDSETNIFVEGDSHALMVSPLMLQGAREKELSISFNLNNADLPYQYYANSEPELENLVVLSWFNHHDPNDYVAHISQFLDSSNIKRVIVFLDTPRMLGARLVPIPRDAATIFRTSEKSLKTLQKLRTDTKLEIIDPLDYFCDARVCPVRSGDEIFFSDADHLSTTGTARLSPLFEDIFNRIKQER